ncbi:MAG TPA: hypothetical protein VID48_06295 [Solirubrobacteraceae bacterium]
MHDEFRVTVEVGQTQQFLTALAAVEHHEQLSSEPGPMAVTQEAERVFIYADTQQAADGAARTAREVLAREGLQAPVSTSRWHPLEERWEDSSLPLPVTDSERQAEHSARTQRETEQSLATGQPQWEVRLTLPSHHEARTFAERLQSDGLPVTRSWRHLLVGANNEDEAHALATRMKAEAPAGTEIIPQGSGLLYWQMLQARRRPFAFFGGLAQ